MLARVPGDQALYAELGDDVAGFGDPLVTSGQSFWNWMQAPAHGAGPRGPTRFWDGVWRSRPDLQAAFPDPASANADAFAAWTRTSGLRELGVPDLFVPGVAG